MKWTQFKDLLPLIGGVVGYMAGLGTVLVTEHRQDRRERVRWSVDRQTTTLVELGDVLRTLSEKVQVVVRQKQLELDSTGKWPDRVPDSDAEWAARPRAFVLMERLDE